MSDQPARPKSLSAEALALQQAAMGESGKVRHRLRKLWGMKRAYRKLLFDTDGCVKPEGLTVLADLVDTAGFARAAPGLEHEFLCELEGRRRVVLHIMARMALSDLELARLQRSLDDMENTE